MSTVTAEMTSRFPGWDPEPDETTTYMSDSMHFPWPLSPLFQTSWGPQFSEGFTWALHDLNLPLERFAVKFRNNYFFGRMIEKQPSSEEDGRKMGELAEATMKSAIGGIMQRWDAEFLPRVLEIQAELRAMAVEQMDRARASAAVERVQDLLLELWHIHFLIVEPMQVGIQLFDDLFGELFGKDADSATPALGVESAAVRSGIAMSRLAKSARALGVADLILSSPGGHALERLGESESGQELLRQLESYLDEFGLHQESFDYTIPTWSERPDLALAALRGYLAANVDREAEHHKLSRQAEQAIDEARRALASYPQPVREQFEAFLTVARNGAYLHEEHNYRIDQQGMSLVRMAFLNIGRYLVESGMIRDRDDVFMLRLDELRAAIAGDLGNAESIVAERQAKLEASRKMALPPFLGPPPQAREPRNAMERSNVRFWGGPPQESASPNELKGNAGSRGVVTGEAFVVRTLQEATAIEPGQILVAITTMPPWTPLFAVAAGVVTETGGQLSHCAIVAREYGIPAVVGAHGATSRIQNGQTITVDGTNGIVRLGS
jgi:pyruvate,water dikinase